MEARITRKTAALAIFLISAFQTYIYAGRPSSCQLLIINSYTENCLWSDDFMAPVYKEFRVQNSPVDICAEHMELMATVVPDMRKQVFMSDRRWISAQCRKEAEEVMPFLLIGGYFWTDSEIKKHLLPVIKSRLDGASHPHRVETIFDYEKSKEWKYKGDKPAIIDLYADWCGPCRQTAPIMKELAKEYAGKIVIYKVNVDKQKELAALFNATSIPLFVFIPMKGDPQLFRGAADKATYKKAIDEFLLK